MSSTLPVAYGLSAGAGAPGELLPGPWLAPGPPTVGEFVGELWPEDVSDGPGEPTDGEPVGLPDVDGLPVDEGEPLGDGLPDAGGVPEPDAVGEQLGVDVPDDPLDPVVP